MKCPQSDITPPRKPDPADRRGPPADPGRALPARALGLRVPPQRDRQPVRLPRRHRPWRAVKTADQRNASGARINWTFTTQRARDKLLRAYPDTDKES